MFHGRQRANAQLLAARDWFHFSNATRLNGPLPGRPQIKNTMRATLASTTRTRHKVVLRVWMYAPVTLSMCASLDNQVLPSGRMTGCSFRKTNGASDVAWCERMVCTVGTACFRSTDSNRGTQSMDFFGDTGVYRPCLVGMIDETNEPKSIGHNAPSRHVHSPFPRAHAFAVIQKRTRSRDALAQALPCVVLVYVSPSSPIVSVFRARSTPYAYRVRARTFTEEANCGTAQVSRTPLITICALSYPLDEDQCRLETTSR